MALTQQKILDAEADLEDLGAIVNGDENTDVVTRTGGTIPSLRKRLAALPFPVSSADLEAGLSSKAEQADLDALAATVGGKAAQADLVALTATVGSKADAAAVALALADKADSATLFAAGGGGLVGYSIAQAYGAGTVGKKLQQLRAALDYANHATADAVGTPLYVSADIASTRANGAAIISPHWGPGQVTTADGNKRGKIFQNVTAAPATNAANGDSVETAFNDDFSKIMLAVEHRISGANTLGTPAAGYLYTPGAAGFYMAFDNSSGWNNATGSNVGRTGATAFRVNLKHRGQGDAVAYNASAFVSSTLAGSTHFLANPAVCLFNGNVEAGANGVYLNVRELVANDNGFDVAAGGDVVNLNRTNDAGAKSAWWWGYRVQSIGTKAVNSILTATGKFNAGIDLAVGGLDFGANLGAITLKANDRIYFNNVSANGYYSTAFNGDYITYATSINGFVIAIGGSARVQITNAQFAVNGQKFLANNKVAFTALASAANDAGAATAGVAVGELYRNGSVVQVRVA